MASSVVLKHGDLFSHPADLVVIPRSTWGSIATDVAIRLREYRINYPDDGYAEHGTITVKLFKRAENIANYVAFAVSVMDSEETWSWSNLEAITRIAKQLGESTRTHKNIKLISTPLLGTGAGHLDPIQVTKCMRDGFLSASNDGTTLLIFVKDGSLFGRMTRALLSAEEQSLISGAWIRDDLAPHRPRRVFVSYSHTTEQHARWVINLAKHLRYNGIESRLDVWHLRPGMDAAQWMSNEIDCADRVILICDERYVERANGREGGVGWEIKLIAGDIYINNSSNIAKYIPIIRMRVPGMRLPDFLSTCFYLDFSQPAHERKMRQALLRSIFDHEEAPEIRSEPVWVTENRDRVVSHPSSKAPLANANA